MFFSLIKYSVTIGMIGTICAPSIFSQCTKQKKHELDSLINQEYKIVKPILVDTYKSDWFLLISNVNTLSDNDKRTITNFRHHIVQMLTCAVQDTSFKLEYNARKAIDYTDSLPINYISAQDVGSQSFSSDIDVSLQGDGTEYSIAIINQLFQHRFNSKKELGEFLDINFYAASFVPTIPNEKDPNYSTFFKNNNWRTFTLTSPTFLRKDIINQTTMALVFMQKNMSSADFKCYTKQSKSIPTSILKKAIHQYKIYNTLIQKQKQKGISQMAAENREYENSLKEATPKRLYFLKQKNEKKHTIEETYLKWKNAVTLSNLNANEAHCTLGAIVHVVANMQMQSGLFKGKPEKKKIPLTPHELYQSFSEQIGFAFHKIDNSHDSTNLIKLGKYIHRAYNAMDNFYNLVPELTPIYTSEEFNAAIEWEGLKKNVHRDSKGKFIKIKKPQLKYYLFRQTILSFNKAYKRYRLGLNIDNVKNIKRLKKNLKKMLFHLKKTVDKQYFEHFNTLYTTS